MPLNEKYCNDYKKIEGGLNKQKLLNKARRNLKTDEYLTFLENCINFSQGISNDIEKENLKINKRIL